MATVADVDNDANTTELKRFYYHTQLIGSITHITDEDEAVVESYEYDAYGNTTIYDIGSSSVAVSQIENPYMYTARRMDEESGLYHYRARAYSPTLRRFIQRDPLEYVDGPNALAYVGGRVTRSGDPTGLEQPPPANGPGAPPKNAEATREAPEATRAMTPDGNPVVVIEVNNVDEQRPDNTQDDGLTDEQRAKAHQRKLRQQIKDDIKEALKGMGGGGGGTTTTEHVPPPSEADLETAANELMASGEQQDQDGWTFAGDGFFFGKRGAMYVVIERGDNRGGDAEGRRRRAMQLLMHELGHADIYFRFGALVQAWEAENGTELPMKDLEAGLATATENYHGREDGERAGATGDDVENAARAGFERATSKP